MFSTLLLAALTTPAASPWADGTMLVLRDSNAVVSTVTDSRITHVALVFNDGARPYVYEATPGRVRRLTVDGYLEEVGRLNERRRQKIKVLAMRPERPYPAAEVDAMRLHAKREIGRRYSVRGYVRDEESEGVHCSEFAAATLSLSDRYRFSHGHRLTPVRLVDAVSRSYQPPMVVAVPRQQSGWAQRTSECWQGFTDWCGWACVETMTFCY